MAEINVSPQALKDKGQEIAEIDVTLDAQSGSKTAGKRAMKNAVVADAKTEFAQQVADSLKNLEVSQREKFATYFAVVDALDDSFAEAADEFLDGLVAEAEASQNEKLSDEEIAAIEENRKNLVKEFKALKNILEMFGEDVSSIADPKIRRGSRGPRGPRTLSKFQYTVNETELESEVNSLSTVAKLCGNIKIRDLKSYISDQGIDLKNPPSEWEAELPNDVGTLYAAALPEFVSDFDEAGDEDEDSESDDE